MFDVVVHTSPYRGANHMFGSSYIYTYNHDMAVTVPGLGAVLASCGCDGSSLLALWICFRLEAYV